MPSLEQRPCSCGFLVYHQSCPVHCFLPRTARMTGSLVQAKGQIETV